MATAAELAILIKTDTSRAQKGLESLGQKVGGLGKTLTKIGAPAMVGFGAIVAGSLKSIDAASDLAETESKLAAVFGDTGKAADLIGEALKGSAQKMLMSRQEAGEAIGTYGNLLTAMGHSKESAAEMSVGLVQLAADLASFNNMDPTEVLEKLRAGLTGETEPLKALGVNMSQARIEAEALAIGLLKPGEKLKDVDTAMQAQIKSAAAYSIIMKDTATAQGDVARTGDGFANSMKQIKAAINDAWAQLGEKLLPAITPLVDKFSDELPGAIDEFVGAVGPLIEQAGEKLPSMLERLGDVLGRVFGFIREHKDLVLKLAVAFGAISAAAAVLGPPLMLIGGLIASLGPIVGAVGGAIGVLIPAVGALAAILGGPLTLAVGATIGAYVLWKKKGDAIKQTLSSVSKKLSFYRGALAAAARGEEYFGAVLGDVGEPLDAARDKIFALADKFQFFTKALGAAIRGDEYFGAVLGDIGVPLDAARDAIMSVGQAFTGLRDDIGGALSQLASLPGEALADMQSAISAAQDAIKDKIVSVWDSIPPDIREDLVLIASAIKEKFDGYVASVKSKLGEILSAVEDTWSDIVTAISDALASIYSEIRLRWDAFLREITDKLDRILSAVASKWNEVSESISNKLDDILTSVSDKWSAISSAVSEKLAAIASAVAEKWQEIKQSVIDILQPLVKFVSDRMDQLRTAVSAAMSAVRDSIINPISDAVSAFRTKISEMASAAASAMYGIAVAIKGGMARVAQDIWDAGAGIVDGIKKGIDERLEQLKSSFWDSIRSVLGWLKRLLGIASPARITIPIGGSLAEGIAVGFGIGVRRVTPAMQRAVRAMLSDVAGAARGASAGVSAAIGGMAGIFDLGAGRRPIGGPGPAELPFKARTGVRAAAMRSGRGGFIAASSANYWRKFVEKFGVPDQKTAEKVAEQLGIPIPPWLRQMWLGGVPGGAIAPSPGAEPPLGRAAFPGGAGTIVAPISGGRGGSRLPAPGSVAQPGGTTPVVSPGAPSFQPLPPSGAIVTPGPPGFPPAPSPPINVFATIPVKLDGQTLETLFARAQGEQARNNTLVPQGG